MERAEKEERLEAIRAAVGDLEESGVPFDVLLPLYEYLAKEEGA